MVRQVKAYASENGKLYHLYSEAAKADAVDNLTKWGKLNAGIINDIVENAELIVDALKPLLDTTCVPVYNEFKVEEFVSK